MRPGQEADTKLSSPAPSGNLEAGTASQGRDVNPEESVALIRQIEAMAEPLGRRLYRGVLKTQARVWSPTEILDAGVLQGVLEQMKSAERGLCRLDAALNRVGPETLVPVLRSLRLDSLAQVDNLDTLTRIVLAIEQTAASTH